MRRNSILLCVAGALALATCRRAPDSPDAGSVDAGATPTMDGSVPLGFTTVRVSLNGSVLAQAETEVAADDEGRVVVAWMDGSPASPLFRLRTAFSGDGGRSFARDAELDSAVRLGDPTFARAPDGGLFLAILRKDNGGLAWSDVALLLYRSTDGGRSFAPPSVVDDPGVFFDRPWLRADAAGRLHLAHLTRRERPDGRYDLPLSHRVSEPGGARWQAPVSVNVMQPPGTPGGLTMGVAPLDDGRVVVAYKGASGAAEHMGSLCAGGAAWAHVREVGAASFGPPIRVTPPGMDVVDNCAGDERAPVAPNPRIVGAGAVVYALWVGEAAGQHALYVAAMRAGQGAFEAPVEVARGPATTLGLPTATIDRTGALHVFWMAARGGRFGPMYARSNDAARRFTSPVAVTGWTFAARGWAGDFNAAVTTRDDLFFSWAATGGDEAGVYVSVARAVVR